MSGSRTYLELWSPCWLLWPCRLNRSSVGAGQLQPTSPDSDLHKVHPDAFRPTRLWLSLSPLPPPRQHGALGLGRPKVQILTRSVGTQAGASSKRIAQANAATLKQLNLGFAISGVRAVALVAHLQALLTCPPVRLLVCRQSISSTSRSSRRGGRTAACSSSPRPRRSLSGCGT